MGDAVMGLQSVTFPERIENRWCHHLSINYATKAQRFCHSQIWAFVFFSAGSLQATE
jgi:hypothetical protein